MVVIIVVIVQPWIGPQEIRITNAGVDNNSTCNPKSDPVVQGLSIRWANNLDS